MKFSVKGIYGSGMVLQQRSVIHIKGTGISGEVVVLSFRDKSYKTKVSKTGEWSVAFKSFAAGGPFTLSIVHGTDTVVYTDIYVGEVWVLSGQSNAQLPMERMRYSYPEEFKLPVNNNVRMITIPISYCYGTQKDTIENPKWIPAGPDTLGIMSGTGYFFAKKLASELNVPVGIINASQGGSPITSWMSEKSLIKLQKKDYLTQLEQWKNPENIQKKIKSMNDNQNAWNNIINSSDLGLKEGWEKFSFDSLDNSWVDCKIPAFFDEIKTAGVMWFKKEFVLSKAQVDELNSKKRQIWMGTIVDADKIWINGFFCGETPYCYPPRRYPISDGVLKEGKNTITVRVQKNGGNPVVFYDEKPYCIFNEDAVVIPVALRNVELRSDAKKSENNFIDISGDWKKKVGCSCENAPAGMFFEWEPTALYNAMLAPCLDYTINGGLWYQGESNAGKYGEYAELLNEMICSWRKDFTYAKKNFPFVVMQLPNWSDGRILSTPDAICWPQLREAQAKAVEITKNTALAITIDGGEWNDLHPEKKQTGGTRAALQALRIGYGKKIAAAPKVKSVYENKDSWIIIFDTDKCPLNAYKMNNQSVDFNCKVDSVCGFALVKKGDGKTFVNVPAKLISDCEVMISKEDIPVEANNWQFDELRYLWEDNPFYINLYNAENIPAAPFRVKI